MTTETSTLGNDIKTIKLGEKLYDVDSLTEMGTNILKDLQKVDGLIQQQQLELSVSTLAKGKLIEELEKESVNFTEVETQETQETQQSANDTE